MTFELDRSERDLLAVVLEAAHAERIRELANTDTAAYKTILRREIGIIENLRARLGTPEKTTA